MFFMGVMLLQCCYSLELQYVNNDQALCLDGSLGSFYFQKGYMEGKNKFLIHFEGGDLILGSSEDEYFRNAIIKQILLLLRQGTQYGSSLNRALSFDFDGLLSQNQSQNINFYNWNIIYINSCDGTGYRQDVVNYQQKQIYFRGELIIKSVIAKYSTQLQSSEVIILSGCSIGAVAALQWSQHITQMIPISVSLLCIADSGILIDMHSIDGSELLKQSLKIMNYVVNVESEVPIDSCAKNYPNQSWKCFYFQNLLNHITKPVFIIQSLYDAAFLQDYLKIECIKDRTLSYCSTIEKDYIDFAYSQFQSTIKNKTSANRRMGSFAPSCISNWYSQILLKFVFSLFLNSASFSINWSIPEKSGKTISQTLNKWIEAQQRNKGDEDQVVLIDDVYWPNNQPCAKLASQSIANRYANILYFLFIILNF
ncbi:unnamed protein product (macronuclear) [Paramecium tetraurelia]|uniref:Pectin acetylesterase n=1 Tax=Paramecium tetraurelia TaxID=5888 RepID=A0DYE7_PARTE|nr:uncharacterized protein GSPATT00003032001 [Paramecium tetraurelia]CAK88064.1 unnamed protein product [Paramecium tetraurelia]|eukprot:XP_001455461.1 hypothetical protein (macronuclear) [Paramecium tetraurelia strain d4-2]